MRLLVVITAIFVASLSVSGQGVCPDGNSPKDRKLLLIEKPTPSYPDGLTDAQGTVTLRVEFLSSAKIGRISIIKGLPHGITEQAISAARRMTFRPEIRDCKSVDVVRPIVYTFKRY